MKKPVERRPRHSVHVGPLRQVRFCNAVFRRQGAANNAFDGASFSAALGDTMAFVGPSGPGASIGLGKAGCS